jgi:hypothetical protein
MKVNGKYALAETVDGTFAKGKYRKDGMATVDVSNDLAKFARNRTMRKALSGSFTTIFGLTLAGYLLGVSTLGLVKIEPLTIVVYPAFSNSMDGGYITSQGVKVFASKTDSVPVADSSGLITKIQKGITGYGEEIIGSNLNVNTFLQIQISSDGRITYTENGQTINTSSVYAGEQTGSYTLKDEYLIECLAGANCQENEIVIIPKNNIIGTVR